MGLYIILEEYIWNLVFRDIYLRIQSLSLFEKFKLYLELETHRYKLLAIFIVPFIFMEVFGALAFGFLGSGLILYFLLLYSVKILLTIPVVIIFNAGRDQLLTFLIINFVYSLILKMKGSSYYLRVTAALESYKQDFSEIISNVSLFIAIQFPSPGSFKSDIINLYYYLKSKMFK
jgi:hypothetical protein